MVRPDGYRDLELLDDGDGFVLARARRFEDGSCCLIKWGKDSETPRALAHEHGLLVDLAAPTLLKPAPDTLLNPAVAVFEDVPGDLLANRIHGTTVPIDQVIAIGQALATALADLHDCGFMHGTLSPHSVLLTPAGELRLLHLQAADFIARRRYPARHPSHFGRLLPWLAPEATGRLDITTDERSDLYALGASLFALLTGAAPLTESDPMALMRAKLSRRPDSVLERRPDTPPALAVIVARLLERRPEARFASAAEVAAALADSSRSPSGHHDGPAPRHAPALALPTRLHGREAQQRRLLAHYDRAHDGASPLVLLCGSQGIGKSTLIEALSARVRSAGGAVLHASFRGVGPTATFGVLCRAFEPLVLDWTQSLPAEEREVRLAELTDARRDLLLTLLPALRDPTEAEPPAPQPGGTRQRGRLMTRLLRSALSGQPPQLLLIDDIERAGEEALELIEQLSGDAGIGGLITVGIGVDTLAVRRLLRAPHSGATEILLPPLEPGACRALLDATLGGAQQLDARQTDRLLALAEGSPARLFELLEALRAGGALTYVQGESADGWRLTDTGALQRLEDTDGDPDQRALRVVLEHLDQSTLSCLEVAAALGSLFRLDVLAAVLGQQPRVLLQRLAPALRCGVLQGSAAAVPLALRFASGEAHRLVYSRLDARRRGELHLRIGTTLRERDDAAEFTEAIRQLNMAAELPVDGAPPRDDLAALNRAAGLAALTHGAPREAFRFMRTGLGLIGQGQAAAPSELEIQLLSGAMQAAWHCGDLLQVERLGRSASIRALQAPERAALNTLTARALLALGKRSEARSFADQALRAAGLQPRTPTRRLRALARRSVAAARAGEAVGASTPGTLLATLVAADLFEPLDALLRHAAAPVPSSAGADYRILRARLLEIAAGLPCSDMGMSDAADTALAASRQRPPALHMADLLTLLHAPIGAEAMQETARSRLEMDAATGDADLQPLTTAARTALAVLDTPAPRALLEQLDADDVHGAADAPGAPTLMLCERYLRALLQGDALPAPDGTGGAWEAVLSAQLGLLHGRPMDALRALQAAPEGDGRAWPPRLLARRLWLEGLTRAELSRQAAAGVRLSHLRAARRCEKRLQRCGASVLASTLAMIVAAAGPAETMITLQQAASEAEQAQRLVDAALLLAINSRLAEQPRLRPFAELIAVQRARVMHRWGVPLAGESLPPLSDQALDLPGAAATGVTSDLLASARDLSAEIRTEAVMERFLDMVMARSGAHTGLLASLDDGQLVVNASAAPHPRAGLTISLHPTPQPIAEHSGAPQAVLRHALRNQAMVLLDDASDFSRFDMHRGTGQSPPASLLCLPLMAGERLEALLCLEHPDDPNRFDARRLEAITLLSGQAGVALANARLYSTSERAREDYRDLFENAVEGLFRLARDGRLLRANAALAATLGYDGVDALLAEIRHLPADVSSRPGDGTRLLEKLVGRGNIEGFELEAFRRDGSPVWLAVSARLAADAEGTPRWIEGSMIDVTERRQRLQAEQEREVAEAATAAKSRFLAIMSHEIRTPMNAILGFAELALSTHLDPTQREYVGTIRDAAGALLGIINDILDFSRIEAGRLQLDEAPADLGLSFHEVERLFASQAQLRGLSLEFDIDAVLQTLGETGLTPSFDALRFRQILVNLVGNALKFTERGSVSVIARAESVHAERLWLEVRVIDTGIGIHADLIPRLFDSFEQLDTDARRRQTGTGLGLSISSQLLEMMGGHIDVVSEPGQGSEFRFSIPLRLVDEPVPLEAQPDAVRGQPLRGRHLLLAEDNRINQRLALEFLQQAGATVDVAADGFEVLQQARANDYDAVLMDLHMPGMDGLQACQALRELPQCRDMPIIAVTADALHDSDVSVTASFDDHLLKPLQAGALTRTLLRHLPAADPGPAPRRRRGEQAIDAADTVPVAGLERMPGIDIPTALKHHDQRPELLIELLGEFVTHYGEAVHELRGQLATGDLAHAERLAHNLFGLAGNFGAARLREAAGRVEDELRGGAAASERALLGLETALVEVLDSARDAADARVPFRRDEGAGDA